jgi:hypothetical protein
VTDRKLDAIESRMLPNCNLDQWLPFFFTLHWPTTTLDVLAFAFYAHTDSRSKMASQNYLFKKLRLAGYGRAFAGCLKDLKFKGEAAQ